MSPSPLRSGALFVLSAALSLGAAAGPPIGDSVDKPPAHALGAGHPTITPASRDTPTAWQRWKSGWVRLEADGNLSCLSRDGTHCLWNSEKLDPTTVAANRIQPLVCGVQHKRRGWPTPGYNDELSRGPGDRHWCRSAYGTLFAEWKDHSAIGTPYMLAETPAGDLMCHSTDGKQCTTAEAFPKLSRADEVHPLVCGAHHRRIHQHDGYGQAGHWCQTPRILRRELDVHVNANPADTELVTVPPWVAGDEPAMVVRATIPPGQSLTLGAFASFSRPLGQFQRREGPAGFVAGKWNLVHAAGNFQEAPWSAPDTRGPVTLAFKVTEKGNMCYFAANKARLRDGAFIGHGALLGNSIQVTHLNGVAPIGFMSSNALKVDVGGRSVIMPAVYGMSDFEARPTSFTMDELILVAARHVPIEGDLTGAKRKISYAADCDGTVPAF